MKIRMAVSVAILGGVVLVACSAKNLYKTSPLLSPVFASPLATVTPAMSEHCISPNQLQASVGKQVVCMDGIVLSTDNSGNDFIMWFGDGRKEAYVVVRNTFYLGSEGSCLHIVGVAQKDAEGRAFIRADDPGQVSPCGPK
jgi:hypothetical protein